MIINTKKQKKPKKPNIYQVILDIKKIHSKKLYFLMQAKNQGMLQIIQIKTL